MRHEKAMWPIIYVRGYAMTEGEIEATTADPFCGFNLGSTVYRAAPDKKAPPRKFIFESPVVRLGSDYGYSCIFDAGPICSIPTGPRPASRRARSSSIATTTRPRACSARARRRRSRRSPKAWAR